MNLKEFKNYIQSTPPKSIFDYGISEPFSWRGAYDEVAFRIEGKRTSREEILKNISMAYTDTFYGYKGGEYNYGDYTDVNFEESVRDYTDGEYCSRLLAEIEGTELSNSQEMRLVRTAFKN